MKTIRTEKRVLRLAWVLSVPALVAAACGSESMVDGDVASAEQAMDVACVDGECDGDGDGHEKIGVCHATGSKKNPYVEIEVDANALNGHIRHGDFPSDDGCDKPPPR